jgi:hypothetical protein
MHVDAWCSVVIKSAKLYLTMDGNDAEYDRIITENVDDTSFARVFLFNRPITTCGFLSHVPQKMKVLNKFVAVNILRRPISTAESCGDTATHLMKIV